MKPDLHMHSTFSDGVLTPSQLVEKAVSMGVTVMAVTDHDTLAGAAALLDGGAPIPVIPGVELSISDMRGLHLLGYGAAIPTGLTEALDTLAADRERRADVMLDKLARLGYPLDRQALMASCAGSIGRAHLARAMVEQGYVGDTQEAFDRFLAEGAPAYEAGHRLNLRDGVTLLRDNGCVPVLAHPALLEKDDMTLRVLLEAWQKLGLMGVEVYHPSQQSRGFSTLESMVRGMGLLVTGGSDFHQAADCHGEIGCTARAWLRCAEDVDALRAAICP